MRRNGYNKVILLQIKQFSVKSMNTKFNSHPTGIHWEDIDTAIETYNLMSEKFFTHASPTLFNSGTVRPQLARYFDWTTFQ